MKQLDSYLNEHLAGSVGALELLDHWIRLYEGKPLGIFFSELKKEIDADQTSLQELMQTLGTKESKFRPAGAWIAEKLGRARFAAAGNEIGGLGIVLVLEALAMGITGKRLLWCALATANLPETHNIDFAELEKRACEQIARIEVERVRAAHEAFSDRAGK